MTEAILNAFNVYERGAPRAWRVVPLEIFSRPLVALEIVSVAAVFVLNGTGLWGDDADFTRTHWVNVHFVLLLFEIGVLTTSKTQWEHLQVVFFRGIMGVSLLSDAMIIGRITHREGAFPLDSAECLQQLLVVYVVTLMNVRRAYHWYAHTSETSVHASPPSKAFSGGVDLSTGR